MNPPPYKAFLRVHHSSHTLKGRTEAIHNNVNMWDVFQTKHNAHFSISSPNPQSRSMTEYSLVMAAFVQSFELLQEKSAFKAYQTCYPLWCIKLQPSFSEKVVQKSLHSCCKCWWWHACHGDSKQTCLSFAVAVRDKARQALRVSCMHGYQS